MYTNAYRRMLYKLTLSYNLGYEILKCILQVYTKDIGLKVRAMKRIHVYKKIPNPK